MRDRAPDVSSTEPMMGAELPELIHRRGPRAVQSEDGCSGAGRPTEHGTVIDLAGQSAPRLRLAAFGFTGVVGSPKMVLQSLYVDAARLDAGPR